MCCDSHYLKVGNGLCRANDRAAAKEAKEIERMAKMSKQLVHDPKGGKNRGSALSNTPEIHMEDQLLPGANKLPPTSRLVGNGLFPHEDLAGQY